MLTTPTLEARWFRRGPLPAAVEAWFEGLGEPVEAETRTDRYLAPSSGALGVKVREGRIEMKRRDGEAGPLSVGDARAETEAWTKWSFALAEPDDAPQGPWLAVVKRRWQRVLELGDGRCTLELSAIAVAESDPWWSVCLEAEGATPAARRRALAVGGARWLGRPDAPALAAADAQGYPDWLRAASQTT